MLRMIAARPEIIEELNERPDYVPLGRPIGTCWKNSAEQLFEDLRRAGAAFRLYHSIDCDSGSKLLFLEQNP
jgi:hypothetical protein